jgi:hypothetical protein
MKKCPTCGKTFDDNMRFCQTDGTALVDDAPAAAEEPFDPYATIVGVPKSAIPPSTPPLASVEPLGEPLDVSPSGTVSLEPAARVEEGPSSSADAGSAAGETASSIPVAPPDDILDLGADPLKTMYVSDAEMKEVLGTTSQGAETPSEEIRADEAEAESPASGGSTDFGSISPPPSPFSAPSAPEDAPVPAPPSFLDTPAASPYSEAETQFQQPEQSFQDAPTVFQSNPEPPQFNDATRAPMQNQEWTPPPAPTPEWQNQAIGSNTPFQPPPAGAAGQNKTLAMVSLISGILSCLCCLSVITGPTGLICGYLAKKNIAEKPAEYGGAGLATAGMVLGGIGTALFVVLIIVQVFFGALNAVLR